MTTVPTAEAHWQGPLRRLWFDLGRGRAWAALTEVAKAEDFAVTDVPDYAVLASQFRDPQSNGFDQTGGHVHVHVVAYTELVLDQHEDPRHKVLHYALQTEGDRNGDDCRARQNRRDVVPQLGQDHQDGNGEDHECHSALSQRSERRQALPAAFCGHCGGLDHPLGHLIS